MRIMMEDDQVHDDVIAKLWQVYSKYCLSTRQFALKIVKGSDRPLPKRQRHGAVLILGMLALARRNIVADRAEVLMRVGLGKRGQVGP